MPATHMQKTWPWLVFVLCFLVSVVASAALVVAVQQEHNTQAQFVKLIEQGKEAHDGVCALKKNLHQQVSDGYVYLAKHPDGAPALGLSRNSILRSIERQQRSLDALKHVHC